MGGAHSFFNLGVMILPNIVSSELRLLLLNYCLSWHWNLSSEKAKRSLVPWGSWQRLRRGGQDFSPKGRSGTSTRKEGQLEYWFLHLLSLKPKPRSYWILEFRKTISCLLKQPKMLRNGNISQKILLLVRSFLGSLKMTQLHIPPC